MPKQSHTPFEIAGHTVASGEQKRIEIPVAKLYDHTDVNIPVEVIRGKQPGPTMFISAAIHGDEINGVEVIKRLRSKKRTLQAMHGTLILVPVVNVFGYNRNVRYLPDRRDLNRSFPGNANGSLAHQFAHRFMTEIVAKCTHGIDLHTGAIHRTNLPQVRAHLDDDETARLAQAFGTPVVLNAQLRDGSLRQAAGDLGMPILLFEGGEALRYEETVIRSALQGILNVMAALGMTRRRVRADPARKPARHSVFIARSSYWIRAPHSGSFRALAPLGSHVRAGDSLGEVSGPFGDDEVAVSVPRTGVVIGMNLIPTVTNGDALYHIATFEDAQTVEEQWTSYEDALTDDS